MRSREGKSRSLAGLVLVGLLAYILFTSVFFTPSARASPKLSLDDPKFAGYAAMELSGFDLGIMNWPGDEFGLGVEFGDKRSVSFGNWSVGPFFLGTFSPKGFDLDNFAGGVKADYFDYRIGGWALSSISRLRVNGYGYSLGSRGSYSLGNLSLAYDLQYQSVLEEKISWFPFRGGSHWSGLDRGGFWGFENSAGSYLTLYGGRRISLGDENITWNQGLALDYRGGWSNLGLVTRIAYRDSFLVARIRDLRIDGWALQFTGEKLTIGFVEYSGKRKKYGISVGYRGKQSVNLELAEYIPNTEMVLNLTVKW